ncbi:MAG: ankyrin repeat domain-containing protein, partial [Burkholderiaceae bacterium]
MRPDPNGNTSSSNPEIQRWYAEQRDHPAAPPVPDPVPQMRARSPQRLHQENDLDTSDDSQADAESDSADTRAAKRQREVEPGELEQMKPAKTRRIEAEPEAEANMQLVSRDEVLPTVAIAKPTVYQQLNEAIRTGDLALLKQILSLKQLDLNASNENGTPPLMLAVEKGHLAIVETLLVEGASPHAVADGVYT